MLPFVGSVFSPTAQFFASANSSSVSDAGAAGAGAGAWAGFGSWWFAAYALVCMVDRMGLVRVLLSWRVYRSTSDKRRTLALVRSALATASPRMTFGSQYVDGSIVPLFVIGLRPLFVAWSNVQYLGFSSIPQYEITVLRLPGSAPLAPDPPPSSDDQIMLEDTKSNFIKVLEPISNQVSEVDQLRTFSEITISAGVPAAARGAIERAARRVAGGVTSGGVRVAALVGAPGCGKSTTARRIAELLGASLYSRYDPTRPGQCVNNLVYTYAAVDKLVVVMEECDVPLSRIMASTRRREGDHRAAVAAEAAGGAEVPRGRPPPDAISGADLVIRDSDKMLRDAIDKASWNMLLDTLQRKANVLLLLTSNRSKDELVRIVCKGDTSLLRDGRVDMWVDFAEAMTPADGKGAFAPREPPPPGKKARAGKGGVGRR